MKRMRKCNDEIYQLAKDQALVKKIKKTKRFRPFCWCPPDPKTLSFMSLILFPTWMVVNDINFGSDKVIQWVPRRHKMLTRGQERLFCKVTSVSIHSFVEWLDTFSYVLRPAMIIKEKQTHTNTPVN